MTHKLIIKSLHDAQAECTCGKWYYCFTGERTKKEIEKEYMKHIMVYCTV